MVDLVLFELLLGRFLGALVVALGPWLLCGGLCGVPWGPLESLMLTCGGVLELSRRSFYHALREPLEGPMACLM